MKQKIIWISIIMGVLIITGLVIFYQKEDKQCKENCTDLLIQKAKELKENMYETVTPKEVMKKREEKQDFILLDVRTKEEYEEGHIKDSILLPVNELAQDIEKKVENKQQEIIVYCRSGNRSKQAVMLLLEIGYTNVKDLGGILDWTYEVVKE